MKRQTFKFAIFSFILLFSTSCDDLKEVLKTNFDYEGEPVEFEIDMLEASNSIQTIYTGELDMSIEDIIAEEAPSLKPRNLKEVTVNSITIDLLEGYDDDNNLQNFESIYVDITAEGMETLSIARVENNPNQKVTSLKIPVISGAVNVRNYLDKPNYAIIIKGKVRKSVTKVIKAQAMADYKFVVGV